MAAEPHPYDHVHHEHHHRDLSGGGARAAVFGVSDGLVSNASLILGVAGAQPAPGIVRLAGLAGMVAGAFSMAAGEYISVRAQVELFQRELDLEREEIDRIPDAERRELARIYESRGVAPQLASDLATEMHRDPEIALEAHARDELGIDPQSLGSPVQAAVSSFGAFGLGALAPLLPWFVTEGTAALVSSMVISALMAVAVGILLAVFTQRPWLRSAARQLAVAALAAGVTYSVGTMVGAGTIN